MIRIWDYIGKVMDEEKCLSLQVAVFSVLPALYFIYLKMTSMYTGIGIKDIFIQNPLEGLNLIMNFSGIYSAYVIYNYKKDKYIKENFLAYLMIGIAQIFMLNTLGIIMMLYSICYFTGIAGIRKCLTGYPWGKSYKALSSAALVFLISLIFLAVRIKFTFMS